MNNATNSGSLDLIIKGATCLLPATKGYKQEVCDVGITDGKIAAVGTVPKTAKKVLKAEGLFLLPGLLDTQVHFREPGNEHKENLSTGSLAAVFGGMTGVFEMPNTKPPTTSAIAYNDKLTRAQGRMWVDFGFYVGSTPENIDSLASLERLPGCPGVKTFMGSSTGNLLVSEAQDLEKILRTVHKRGAFHAEDEARLNERKGVLIPGRVDLHPVWRDEQTAFLATRRLVETAKKLGKNVHVLHVTTAEEIEFLSKEKATASVEVTPQHLTLSAPECYERLGTLAQMNPPIRDQKHLQALWRGIADGTVDVIGSDHAPHTLEEKKKTYPDTPSGMTGVQTLLPIMLNHCHNGKLSLERLVELLHGNPVRLFGLKNRSGIVPGAEANLTLIDYHRTETITNRWIKSLCGWTPFDGMKVKGWPFATLIRGEVIMREGELTASAATGRPLVFE